MEWLAQIKTINFSINYFRWLLINFYTGLPGDNTRKSMAVPGSAG
jgi:hypothetical protein